MINLLIADDHPVVREGLKQILKEDPIINIKGEATNGREVLSMVKKNDYDVVLLDISMPMKSGIEVLGEIKKIKPNLPVLILSIHPEEQFAIRALKAGASGYLTKECAPEELILAIKKVSQGYRYITPSLAETILDELDINKNKPLHNVLSDREYQVMLKIVSGKTIKEIAKELFLSPKTVSTYRTRILKKMKMRNNAELIHYAIKNHLIE